MLDIEIYDLKT